MKIRIAIIIFLLLGAFFIISENHLALKDSENINKFVLLYTDWLGKLYENSVSTTGYLIKMEWLPSPELTQNNKSLD